MAGNWLAAAAGTIAGVGGMLYQSEHEKKMQNKQFSHDMEMAKYAYGKDLEMWNLQNQYNSPSAQMDRYRAAGLNPHLVATRGNAGNASTMPQYQQVRSNHGKAGSGVLEGIQMANLFADLKIKDAQADNLRANTDQATEQTVGIALENTLKELDVDFQQYWSKGLVPGNNVMFNFNNKGKLIGANAPRYDLAIKEAGAKLKYVEAENEFNEFRKRLNKANVNVTDPALERLLYKTLKDKGWLDNEKGLITLLGLLLRGK